MNQTEDRTESRDARRLAAQVVGVIDGSVEGDENQTLVLAENFSACLTMVNDGTIELELLVAGCVTLNYFERDEHAAEQVIASIQRGLWAGKDGDDE